MASTILSPGELLTRPQAAQLLGVQVQTLAIWASTGRYALPFVKVGRSVRYRRSDLERFLEARTSAITKSEGPPT